MDQVQKKKWLVCALTALLIAVASGIGWYLYAGRTNPPPAQSSHSIPADRAAQLHKRAISFLYQACLQQQRLYAVLAQGIRTNHFENYQRELNAVHNLADTCPADALEIERQLAAALRRGAANAEKARKEAEAAFAVIFHPDTLRNIPFEMAKGGLFRLEKATPENLTLRAASSQEIRSLPLTHAPTRAEFLLRASRKVPELRFFLELRYGEHPEQLERLSPEGIWREIYPQVIRDLDIPLENLVLPEEITPKIDRYSYNMIANAIASGQTAAAIRMLQDGADPNLAAPDDQTLLMLAARDGHDELVLLLLKKGADPNKRNQLTRTALMQAVSGDHFQTAKLLLDYHADPNARDEITKRRLVDQVRTPIMRALLKVYGAKE